MAAIYEGGSFPAVLTRLVDLETQLTPEETVIIARVVRAIVTRSMETDFPVNSEYFQRIRRLVAYCHGARKWDDDLVCLQAQGWAAGELILLTDQESEEEYDALEPWERELDDE